MSPCKPCFLSLCCPSSPLSPIWMAGKSPQTDGQLLQPTLSLLLRPWVSVCACLHMSELCLIPVCIDDTDRWERQKQADVETSSSFSEGMVFWASAHTYIIMICVLIKKKTLYGLKMLYKSTFPSFNCKTFTFLHHRISRVFRTVDVYMNWIQGHYSELLFMREHQ